ncbi:MAG: hypothetical protein AAF609_22855 [Cyanobacteria bacterium P01_C01_bin.120]
MDYERLRTAMQLRQVHRPWWVAVRGEFGWQVRCRFAGVTAASAHAVRLRQVFGYQPNEVTVSSVEDGAELWELEWAMNRLRHYQAVERAKLQPDEARIQLLQNEIAYLMEEAVQLACWRGFELQTRWRGDRLELRKGCDRSLSTLPEVS